MAGGNKLPAFFIKQKDRNNGRKRNRRNRTRIT